MVADGKGSTNADNSSVPKLRDQLRFKIWLKFFKSFLMRKDRAHLCLLQDCPKHFSDLDGQVPKNAPMTEKQAKLLKNARKRWVHRNEIAFSYLMEVCNSHQKASNIAALYEGNNARELLKKLEDRFENVEKNTIQSEVSKFNSMEITCSQTGAEFVEEIEKQAKVLEDLGQTVTEDDKLTRLKEGLMDNRYSQLAHSLYTATSMTFEHASSLVKGYENTTFGKAAIKKGRGEASTKDETNLANEQSWREHKKKAKCNKCKKPGHFARECRTPQHVIDRMKKKQGNHSGRGDKHETTTRCEACNRPGHKTSECTVLQAFRRDYAKKRQKEKDRNFKVSKRPKLRIQDSDNSSVGSGSDSHVCIEEVNIAQDQSEDKIYVDCGCNRVVLTSREHLTQVRKVNREMGTAGKEAKLKVTAEGTAGVHKNVYFAPKASKNLMCIKSITEQGVIVWFDEDEIILTDKKSGEEIVREKAVNGLYPLDLKQLLYLKNAPAEANLADSKTDNKCELWHRRLGHTHENKIIEADRTGLISGLN